jgi:hypothetical protein
MQRYDNQLGNREQGLPKAYTPTNKLIQHNPNKQFIGGEYIWILEDY